MIPKKVGKDNSKEKVGTEGMDWSTKSVAYKIRGGECEIER